MGIVPGHPASHGCVRLPAQFARELFDITRRDETVVISPDGRTDSLLAVGLPEWQARQVGQADSAFPELGSISAGVSVQETASVSFETGSASTVLAD